MRFLLAALLICLNLNNIYAWDLEKNKDGIKVYTRPVAGSPIKEFRGVMIVKSSMAAPIALLDKSKLAPRWIHQCKSLVTLKKINDFERINYNVTDLPFPVTDRDAVIRSKVKKNNKTGVVSVTLTEVKNFKPENSDYVRVKKLRGKWTFTPLEDGQLKIVYQVHSDPGGSLPGWLINSGVVDMPFNTLKKMRTFLPKYQNASVSILD